MEFALSSRAATASQDDEDDYDMDDEPTKTTPPLDAPVSGHLESSLDNSLPSKPQPSQMEAEAEKKHEALLSEKPGTVKDSTVAERQLQESQDSGFGSQTPPTDMSLPSELSAAVEPVAQTVTADSADDDQTDLPDNIMSLEELHAKVQEYFPGFKPNCILRFSSLLGPGKPSSLPKIWSEAKKPPRRKKRSEPVEWKLDCNFIPPPEMINTDDEVREELVLFVCGQMADCFFVCFFLAGEFSSPCSE